MRFKNIITSLGLFNLTLVLFLQVSAAEPSPQFEYRLLAALRTSTMEKELNEAADAGFRFTGVMAGETALGGSEVVVVMSRPLGSGAKTRCAYKLLATSRTSTMQKELQEYGEKGFEYKGQTVFNEVIVILEQDRDASPRRYHYQLAATSKTSTMDKELNAAGRNGFSMVGVTVAKTPFGGKEVVAILSKLEML